MPQQVHQDKFPQQESQVEWWIPEDKPQHTPPAIAEQVQSSDHNQQPMFCSQEGFYRHPENCSQFIRCVEIGRDAYAVHFFECPKQLVFDEKDSSCIVADIHSCRSNTRTKRQVSSTSLKCKGEGFFRHPEDCRAFYRCVKSATGQYETHHFSCPANLVFDEEYTTCNWPEKAPPCSSQEQAYKPTRKPVKPVETQKPKSQYKPPSRSTSGGSWSTAKPRNDFIDKSITQETYGKRISTSRPKSTTQSYERGAKCRSPGFFRNDDDCTKFFKCVKKGNSFIRYELSCPQKFAYDDMSKRCIAQRYVASCNRNKPPYPPRQDDEETTASPETTSAKSSNSESGSDDIVCEKEGYFRHPDDCNKFYRCVDFSGDGQEFVRYDFNCPEGLVFDEANSVCNWPDQSSPCDTRGGGGQGLGGDGNDGSETEGNVTGGNEENGGRGDENEESASPATTQSSPAPSESTSSAPVDENEESNKESEEQGESNKDTGGSGSAGECTKEGFYRNPEDCNKFYRCVDFDGEGKEFVRYDFSCPEGLVFDEANSVCNWPADSEPCDTRSSGGNGDGNERDGTDTSTSVAPDRDGESSESSSQREQTTPSGIGSSESSSERDPASESSTEGSQSSTSSNDGAGGTRRGSSGECTEEGFFRDPEDCNKFYRCVDQNENGQFVKYDFTCPEGLVFDEVNSVCNWPDQSAPCDGGSPGRGESSTSEPGSDASESSEGTTSSTQGPSEESSRGTTESSASSTQSSQPTDSGDASRSTTERSTSESGGNEGSSDTSESQGECTEEGFYRNPEDCNKFYRCVDFNGDGQQFVRYDFDCPEGLVFDEVNSVCNWPDQSPPCETRGGAPGNETTDSDRGSSTTESSSEQPQSSTEQTTQSTTQQPTEQTTQSPTQQPTEQSTQRGGEQSTSDSSTSGDSSECTEPGFYRCKDDCNKFYRCVEEDGKLVRYDFKCPDGLIFDDKNKKCDWPSSELTCDSDSSSTTSSYESSTTSTTQSSTTRSETSSSASTTKECTEEGFFRDPDDCSKYYRCIDEGDGTFTREDYSCADDEVFDEEMRYCNRKDLAPPCDGSQTTSGGSQSTTERSTTSTQSSTQSSTKSGESSECTQPGFFRCPEDCTKFYRCVEEDGSLVRYDFHCPDGLIFDEKNDKCDWPSSELTCDSSSSSTTESSSSASQTSGTTAQESSSSSTTSSSSGTSSEGCTEEGFFRNPEDCSKYYRCIDEGDGTLTREDFACGEDEVFDEEMRYCNRKDLAPPCDETSSTTESSRSSTSQSSTQQESETSTSSSSTTSGSSGSGECTEEGFHRDPNDCSKFYRCVDFQGDGQSFTRYDFDCPEGLVFDESNDVCNWPSSVPSCESGGESESSRGSSTDSSSTTSSPTSDSSTSSSVSQTEQTTSASHDNDRTTGGEQSTSESSTASTSSESGTTSSAGTSSTSSSRGSGSSENIECTEEGFFRHPDDCSKFYRCVDFAGTGESFVRYDFECAEGTVFDEVNSVCNWPNMSPPCETGSRDSSGNNESESSSSNNNPSTTTAGTAESSTERSGTPSQSDSSPTPQDQTTRSSTSTTSSSSDEFQCQEEGFFKHPTDCRKYYECKRDEETGELVKIDCECPEGQVWDNDGWYCNAADLSPPCESGSSFRCREEGFFRDPEDCTKYYQCNRTGPGENDFTSERHQCDDGLVFDEEGRYCNAPELSEPCDGSSSTSSGNTSSESPRGTSPGTSAASGECTREGFFRNPDDCTKYYLCSRNNETGEFEKTDYSCPDGRIFDEGSNYCNEPELSEEPCESSGQSTTTKQTSSTSGGTSEGSTSSGTRRGGGNPECTQEGFFRHPDDCAKFYRCVDFSGSGESFVRYDFDCPEGTHFDEVNSVCNWPTMTPACESSNLRVLVSIQ